MIISREIRLAGHGDFLQVIKDRAYDRSESSIRRRNVEFPPTGNSWASFSTRVRRTTTRGAGGTMTRSGPVAVPAALGTTRRRGWCRGWSMIRDRTFPRARDTPSV